MICCSVESCDSNLSSNRQTKVSFFDFPKWEDSERFQKWTQALGKPAEHFKEKNAFVCSKHFYQEDLIPESLPPNLTLGDIKFKLRLADTAVPRQYLGGDGDSISNNRESDSSLFISCSESIDFIKEEVEDEDLSDELYISEENDLSSASEVQTGPLKIDEDAIRDSKLGEISQQHEQNSCGERPLKQFRCPKCKKVFAWANELKRHRRLLHNSYRCNICSKYFSSQGSVITHKSKKHNVKFVFKCQLCDEGFITSKELLHHTKVHHKRPKRLVCFTCNKKVTITGNIKNKKC